MKFTVVVPGVPIPQPRHRRGKGNRMYLPDDHPVHGYKQSIRHFVANAKPKGWPLDALVSVEILFLLPRLKKDADRGLSRYPCISKPDIDNFLKSCFDSLKSVLWNDDCQVWRCLAEKAFVAYNEKPCTYLVFTCEEASCLPA